jgi:hypothetical protein
MKKTFFKQILLLLLGAALYAPLHAQEYDPESEMGQQEETETYNEHPDFDMDVVTTTPVVTTETRDNKKSLAATSARPQGSQKNGVLNGPPDCPECTPDPGGDIADVPFDKNLLIILFAGAAYIVIRGWRRKKIDLA